MPDGMSPENKPQSSMDYMRSYGKPADLPADNVSMQAAKDFPQPESRANVPDIRMQLGGRGDEQNELNVMDLIRAMSGRAATSGLEKFSSGLQGIAEAKKTIDTIEAGLTSGIYVGDDKDNKEIEQQKTKEKLNVLRENLQKRYNSVQEQSIGVVNDLFTVSIDQKKNAYPYDHRTAELTIRTILETAQALQNEEWADDPELSPWLKRMEKDATWMSGFLQVSVAESASAPYYFDVVMQLQVLKERYKAFITSEDLRNMHQKELPGLEFSNDEQATISEKNIGLVVNEKYRVPENPAPGEEGRLLGNKENVGLRELGVRMIDSSFAMRMKIAAVSQADFLAANPEETTFMDNNLKPEELAFYKELLWRKDKDKGYILAPHVVSKDGEKRESSAYLEALLLTNAEERLNKIIAGGVVNKDSAISELVKDVKSVALERISYWKSRDKGDIVSQLATLITKQGLYEDYAFLNVYKYCWQYVWKVDNDGKITEKDKIDIGSIYSYSGDAYSLYYMRRAAQYDKQSNSRTQLLLPTSKTGRKEVELLPYDKMPKYVPGLSGDQDRFLAEQWNFLFGDDPVFVKARRDLGYQDIPKKVAKKLTDWAVAWKTPYSSKYVEDGTTEYELIIPHLMPPGLDIACFLDTLTDKGTKLYKDGGESVWKSMVKGKRFSEVSWDKQENLPVDRWLVDLDMASRYMNVLIGTFDKEKDPIMGLIGEGPSTLAPKEFAKRLRLSFRDSPEGYPEEYEMAFIPFIVTLSCMEKYNLSSAGAWHKINENNKTSVEEFLLEISKWQRAFKWLPPDRPDTDLLSRDSSGKVIPWDYGNTMALIMEYYVGVLLRMAKSSAESSRQEAFNNYENTSKRVSEMPFMRKGTLNRKINTNLTP
ncbi:MAG: hypothetical protein UU51_C0009G0008 [Microgenomates group bacterium GW2011_GWC1_41_20]|uniref:Uncharacterized protein n=7 Tax=Candidatus Woeseibacteriota TaxID=1752722 RepID=A0A0G0RU12_9BACT|nr:MAG: hypothetical protein UT76_C0011G0006 [Candidatus Woesebacteria bacterium GW2011_GWB1_40_12]KKR56028.1 MAG: hypothetical protein UT93_C0007G0002 [Candidatus Woesebacteria bacterium GW2011_GWF1_40_24]KKR89921.1 MAG: hypothetical protein UU39_C0022G0003 [Candidatus Woesebacteria bacterium GW2011_GWD1_41_12]KKS00381.1 MAG: hypothetical protein UU51_C0009G0008 [Microgenomates group bacterium GW2011_GWC1_41_20]KKS03912.1 MAG: hypothetical protein UU57_C0027G0004 [Candidatus Woesebacteria bact